MSFLPEDVIAPSIHTLNLEYNKFNKVPKCVCSFFSLQYLDISYNPDILILPVEMGRLLNLNKLLLNGLKDLNDPPRNIQRDARDCIRYLNSKLRSAQKFYRMKLMLVGKQDRGKTTLVARLHGKSVGQNQSTVGVDVSQWSYAGRFNRRKRYHFSIWDFGGQKEYYATHQCFLSEQSMYLLLWNVTHGKEGIQELKPWLDNIYTRAPHSCVIIVATHLDEIRESERSIVDNLLHQVSELTENYSAKLHIQDVLAVGLMNKIENIVALREAIYSLATIYTGKGILPIMGREVPSSYFKLNTELEKIQERVRTGKIEPIMHAEQFKDLVQQLKLPDIWSNDELHTATLFLNEVGTILHYNDRSHGLNELYFIDPHWLCDMMSKVVTVHERNPFVKNGILPSSDVPLLFRDTRFPWKYFEQYLTLLDRFEIALPLDNTRILIPSMLPEGRPKEAEMPFDPRGPYYRRYITFSSTPPGFWSRLISRVMHSVPQVCKALDYNYENLMSGASLEIDGVAHVTGNKCTNSTSPTNATAATPFLLPNIPPFIDIDDSDDFSDPKDVELVYWREGIVCKSPELNLCVEALHNCGIENKINSNGILIMASPSPKGKNTLCLLVDIIMSLIHEWYPGLEEVGCNEGVKQIVPCYECLKMMYTLPHEFHIDAYKSLIISNRLKINCSNSHSVALADVMPDLLLQDLDKRFLLSQEEVIYQENADSLLGEGGFGRVYKGKCRGKNVAIKKYVSTQIEDVFDELRVEAKLLQKSYHPCLVCLVGVTLYPSMALVMEEAPMGSLEKHFITKATPISRIVLFRIASQVAAALRFLHQHGIVFRDLKASNVLLWSLDEESLCHCKVTDFGIATHLSPFGTLRIEGTKGFIAPEVLNNAVYNHKADIFSFSMLLYQMITRRHPFHSIQPLKINLKILNEERPSTMDISAAEIGYFYLTRVMESCWEHKPENRPDTDELITRLSDVIVQSTMSMLNVSSRFSLRHGCAVTSRDYAKAGINHVQSSELWICCDGEKGAELNIYNTNHMVKLKKHFIKRNQVQFIHVCGHHIWVCSKAGIESGVIDIFNIISQDLVHTIDIKENAACCITATNDCIYLGTLEGYVFAFKFAVIQAIDCHQHQYVSENAIEGIIATKKHIWVSHTHFISFLDIETLTIENQQTRNGQNKKDFIGSLYLSEGNNTVWSAQCGGSVLSSWNVETKTHMYDINTSQVLLSIYDCEEYDAIITCMTPALDTLWVGMATGHIMVFHDRELLFYVRPYEEYIRFLIPIPCEGPTQKEKCMVVSGAKHFQSPLPEFSTVLPKLKCNKTHPVGHSGVMILWEAYTGATLRQMKGIASKAPMYLKNHKSVAETVCQLNFKDDTHILDQNT